MRSLYRLVPALLALTAVALAADQTKRDLDKQYATIGTAYRHNDIDTISAMIAPEFTLTTPQGTTWDRNHMIKDLKSQMSKMKDAKWTRKVKDYKTVSDHVDATITGHFSGWFGKDHKQHFELESLTVDSWRKGDHGWMLIKSDVKKLDPKIDGKAPGG